MPSTSRFFRPSARRPPSSPAWSANWIIQFAMYVFVASIPFESSLLAMESGGSGFGQSAVASLSRFSGALLLLAALTDVGRVFRGRSWGRWGFGAFGLFCAIRLIDNHFRIQYPITFNALSISWQIVIFVVVVGLWRDPVLRRRSMIVLLYALNAVAILQLLGSAYSRTGQMVWGASWERVGAFGQDPNFAGAQLGAGLLLALLTALRVFPAGRITARLAWLFSFLCLGALIQTGSRGAVLSVGLASLALLWSRQTQRYRFRIYIAAIVVLASIAGFVLTSPGFMARFEKMFDSSEKEQRPEIYRRSIELAKEAPLFGHGPERNALLLGDTFGLRARDMHNILLWALTAAGLIGLAFYLIGAIGCLGHAYRARSGPEGVAPLVLGAMAFLFGQTASWHLTKMFWILMAFAATAALGSPVVHKARRAIRLTLGSKTNPLRNEFAKKGGVPPPLPAAADPAANVPGRAGGE